MIRYVALVKISYFNYDVWRAIDRKRPVSGIYVNIFGISLIKYFRISYLSYSNTCWIDGGIWSKGSKIVHVFGAAYRNFSIIYLMM